MNTITILDTYTDALVADTDIAEWCEENYRAQKVYQGVDPREPPGEDDVPATNITLETKKVGYSLETRPHGLGVVCVIYDTEKTTTTADSGTILIKYTGARKIEQYRKLVETCIVGVDTGAGSDVVNLRIDELDIEYEMVEHYPFFKASMLFTFNEDYYQGDSVFV